jgi:hypothetical protein
VAPTDSASSPPASTTTAAAPHPRRWVISTADLPPKKEEGDRSAEEAEKRDRFEKNGKNLRTDFKKGA